MVKNLPADAGDAALIPGLGRFPTKGNGNPLHYSFLENPWTGKPTVHGVTKESDTT